MESFSPETVGVIGTYVYGLIDPRAGDGSHIRMFYVGKGTAHRCFDHARGAQVTKAYAEEDLKLSKIQSIMLETGEKPEILILAYALTVEEAYRLESVLIRLLLPQTNIVSGHDAHRYCVGARELDARYANPIGVSSLGKTVVLVSLNGGKAELPYPKISHDEDVLARRTLGDWVIQEKRAATVEYVVGVYNRLTRCVYRVHRDNGGNARYSVTQTGKN
jgi:hypothetical protein